MFMPLFLPPSWPGAAEHNAREMQFQKRVMTMFAVVFVMAGMSALFLAFAVAWRLMP